MTLPWKLIAGVAAIVFAVLAVVTAPVFGLAPVQEAGIAAGLAAVTALL